MDKIKTSKTYSSQEAADLLGMNINTFQKLAREEKIRVYRTGKNYRVTGLALLDYMNIPPTRNHSDLVVELNQSVRRIIPILKKEDKDLGVFLHQSINLNADEVSIEKIIDDINRYISLSENKV